MGGNRRQGQKYSVINLLNGPALSVIVYFTLFYLVGEQKKITGEILRRIE